MRIFKEFFSSRRLGLSIWIPISCGNLGDSLVGVHFIYWFLEGVMNFSNLKKKYLTFRRNCFCCWQDWKWTFPLAGYRDKWWDWFSTVMKAVRSETITICGSHGYSSPSSFHRRSMWTCYTSSPENQREEAQNLRFLLTVISVENNWMIFFICWSLILIFSLWIYQIILLWRKTVSWKVKMLLRWLSA